MSTHPPPNPPSIHPPHRQRLGAQGEQRAACFLQDKGFEIVATNWRHGRLGELDLIAYHPERCCLAFVEVKTRKNSRYGLPIEAITPHKQDKMLALAQAYLAIHPMPEAQAFQFDVIGILWPGGGQPAAIQHLEGAFHLE